MARSKHTQREPGWRHAHAGFRRCSCASRTRHYEDGLGHHGYQGQGCDFRPCAEYVEKKPRTSVLRALASIPVRLSLPATGSDPITGDRPMYVLSFDAHDIWFNTAAMKAVGIGANTPDPDPGSQYFARGADRVPTGYGVETAATMLGRDSARPGQPGKRACITSGDVNYSTIPGESRVSSTQA